MTEGDGFATSCKDLSEADAERIIRKMEFTATAKRVWKSYKTEDKSYLKYDELGNRPGMASPKQIRMIEAMWADVSKYKRPEARERALRYFLHHITGVDSLRFLELWQVQKIVKALQKMKGGRQ